MKLTPETARRALYGAFATCRAGGAAVAAMAVRSVGAQPPTTRALPARSRARSDRWPPARATTWTRTRRPTPRSPLPQQGGPQALVALKSYFDANTQASKDLQALQQPLQALAGRCKLPITLPQIMRSLQAAQKGRRAAGRFAGTAAQRAERRRAGSGFASSVLARCGRDPGRRSAARSDDGSHAVAVLRRVTDTAGGLSCGF